jgi:hypothetical protein
MAIPRTEPELVIWLGNFAHKFDVHGPALGFSAAEITALQADAAMLNYLISDVIPAHKSGLDALYSYKSLIKNGPVGTATPDIPAAPTVPAAPATVAPGVLPRLRQLIQRIRNTPGYTADVGEDLGIEGTDDGGNAFDPDTVKPTLRATALTSGHVRVQFDKKSFDGVYIESRRRGETDWTQLGIDLFSPYVDTRPPAQANTPEVREYRARYLQDDAPTGGWSDIVSATTTP